jgi:putative membrane protein
MLWIKAFHLIFMVTWFSGLFYLPRLFVYHAEARDQVSKERFKIMERKLYYMIMTPGGILTLLFGFWLMQYNMRGYLQMPWFEIKLILVFILVLYHIFLGLVLNTFKCDKNTRTHVFYRWINEIPTLFLIAIVILAVVKPY